MGEAGSDHSKRALVTVVAWAALEGLRSMMSSSLANEDGCSTAAPDPPSACHARWCATEGASGEGGISTGGSRPARETGIGRARGICDDGSGGLTDAPTARRRGTRPCRAVSLSRHGKRRGGGGPRAAGGRPHCTHVAVAPPVTARRGESSATGGARSSAGRGGLRARGSRRTDSSVSRECASAM